MSAKLQESKDNGAHAMLGKLVGEWEGMAKTWFEPDKVADESPSRGTIKLILNGSYALYEYKGSFGGKPLEGMAIIGYHLDLRKFECAWVDSFHTGSAIIFSEGKRNENDIKVTGQYAYVTPDAEQYWGWRTEIAIVSDNEIVFTAFNISPEGEEQKATELRYNRVGE